MRVCHLDGSGEEGVCELPHVVWPGGGEERGLARGVSLRHDGADIPLETLGTNRMSVFGTQEECRPIGGQYSPDLVEHSVGLVQHEVADPAQLAGAVRHQVHQPARRGHHHLDQSQISIRVTQLGINQSEASISSSPPPPP